MKRVVVGLSGGVDSSVAAYLLKEQGYDVVGLFMRNWKDTTGTLEGDCPWYDDHLFAELVAKRLDIPFHMIDLSDEYRRRVVDYMFAEYARGRTPNPDVLCNREIKFGPFREYAKKLGADFIATGHYCGIAHTEEGHLLLKAADAGKDQTYFLNQVTQPQFENVLFPLGGLQKSEVRAIAEREGLSTARKKDSTGVCFIGERNFRKFLQGYLPARPGRILTCDGREVGRHIGLMYYTLGQRRGLDIGGQKGDEGGRWFVIEKDLKNNILYVAHGDESALYSRGCTVSGMNWIPAPPKEERFSCTAKFRYRQGEQAVTVTRTGADTLTVMADEPQRAVTPGQYAVLYRGGRCLGGGVIGTIVR